MADGSLERRRSAKRALLVLAALPLSPWLSAATFGSLGGRKDCWGLWYSYGTCCDESVWGEAGNRDCWAPSQGFTREYCCSPEPPELQEPCEAHLRNSGEKTAYALGRSLEILACRYARQGPAEALAELQVVVPIAAALPDQATPHRGVALVALEWYRLSRQNYSAAAAQVAALEPAGQSFRGPQLGTLRCLPRRGAGGSNCATAKGMALRQCATQRRTYPRIRGQWSAWGFDGTTRIGRTIWCLCADPEVRFVLDLFAHVGSGSALVAAHALEQTGGGELVTLERDASHARAARENLAGYASATLLEGEATLLLPDLCARRTPDLVVLDSADLEGPAREALVEVVRACHPRRWVINNVQFGPTANFVQQLLGEDRASSTGGGHRLVLHDFSPSVAALKYQLQEFAVLERTDLQS